MILGYRIIKRASFLASLVLFSLGVATAQSWVQLSPSGTPPLPRYVSRGVYDAATNEMIIVGGGVFGVGDPSDVWALSVGGSPSWAQLSPTGTPPAPRIGPTIAYDAINARIILFGGGLGTTSPCANDVWVLLNANSVGGTPAWIQLSPSGPAPAPRWVSSAVYDPATNRMTVFGGNDCFSGLYNDVWVLSNANGLGGTPAWTQLTPSGALPPGNEPNNAVYDPASNRMIVVVTVGNSPRSNQVWVLTNANGSGGTPSWIQLAPAGTAITGRTGESEVYDAQLNQLIVFGGGDASDFNDTWVLSNANGLGGTPAWTQLTPSGALPPPREGFPAVFDSSTKHMIVFAGYSNGPYLNDAWVLTTTDARQLKTAVLNQINALLSSANKHDQAELASASFYLSKALDPALWQGGDGDHLNVQRAAEEFLEEGIAAVELAELLNDPHSSIPAPTVRPLLSELVQADRILATVAITDASGRNAQVLTKASAQVALGDGASSAGKYIQAITNYAFAWALAHQAM